MNKMEKNIKYNLPTFDDYILWIEKLVHKYGVEIDIFAWEKIKKRLKDVDDGK